MGEIAALWQRILLKLAASSPVQPEISYWYLINLCGLADLLQSRSCVYFALAKSPFNSASFSLAAMVSAC